MDLDDILKLQQKDVDITGRGIYVIYNIKSKKIYVGSSENMKRRLSSHRSNLLGGSHINKSLLEDFLKEGLYSFVFCPLFNCEGALLAREKEILQSASDDLFYNDLKYKTGKRKQSAYKQGIRYLSATKEQLVLAAQEYLQSGSIYRASKKAGLKLDTTYRFLSGQTFKKIFIEVGLDLDSYKNKTDKFKKLLLEGKTTQELVEILKIHVYELKYLIKGLGDSPEMVRSLPNTIYEKSSIISSDDGGVYMLYCEEENKCYVGSSNSIMFRVGTHFSELRRGAHRNKVLQNLWDKYRGSLKARVIRYIKKVHTLDESLVASCIKEESLINAQDIYPFYTKYRNRYNFSKKTKNKSRRLLSKTDFLMLVSLLDVGEDLNSICQKLEVMPNCIYLVLQGLTYKDYIESIGYTPKQFRDKYLLKGTAYKRLSVEEIKDIKRGLDEGLLPKVLAIKYSCSYTTIEKIRKNMVHKSITY